MLNTQRQTAAIKMAAAKQALQIYYKDLLGRKVFRTGLQRRAVENLHFNTH
jgi:hypothetical protein